MSLVFRDKERDLGRCEYRRGAEVSFVLTFTKRL